MVRITHINLANKGMCKFVSPYEAEILRTLWEEGSLNSTEIQQCLKDNNRNLNIATVSGLLARLVDAGYVIREIAKTDSKHRYVYSAKAGEKEMAERISHSILEHLKDAFGSDIHEYINSYT